jgi:acyl-coenzyme A thioesterase PaaI-like protein
VFGASPLRGSRVTLPGTIFVSGHPTLCSRPASTCRLRLVRPVSTSPPRRQTPTQSTSATASVPPAEPATPSTTTQPTRSNRHLILPIVCLLLGGFAGTGAHILLSPPTPPVPGSEQDAHTIRWLHNRASELPIVKELTAGTQGDNPAWESWDAYESIPPERRAPHLTAGALAGSRGVGGYQRVWRNKATGEVVSVIFFGGATTGWPGVVHGGCLATILDESCGRVAFLEWNGKPGLTASLGIEYKRATMANGFYVVRAKARSEEELPEEERGKRHYKCWIDARVEDAATGELKVVAEALYVGGEGKKKEMKPWGERKKKVVWDEKEQAVHARF